MMSDLTVESIIVDRTSASERARLYNVTNADDLNGLTALHYAARKENLWLVKLSVETDADANKPDGQHCMPIFIAMGRKNLDLVNPLLP
jgi:ankyrin repeat protein